MIVTELTAPAAEPLTLAEAKAHLKVEHSDEDALIEALIVAARSWAEDFTRRVFVQRQLRLTLNGFPCSSLQALRLPRPPLVSVSEIVYLDSDGVEQTWASSGYLVDAASAPGRVMPAYGGSWPSTQARMAAAHVDYVAGYAPAETSPTDHAGNVPQPVKLALLLLLTQWHEQRSDLVLGAAPQAVPNGAKALLWPLRALEV